MPRDSNRRAEIVACLYRDKDSVNARDLADKLKISKQIVYQAIEDLIKLGYLDVTIKADDRVRRYRLKDNYREWYAKGEELGIPIDIQLRGSIQKTYIPKGKKKAEEKTRLRHQIAKTVVEAIIEMFKGNSIHVKKLAQKMGFSETELRNHLVYVSKNEPLLQTVMKYNKLDDSYSYVGSIYGEVLKKIDRKKLENLLVMMVNDQQR